MCVEEFCHLAKQKQNNKILNLFDLLCEFPTRNFNSGKMAQCLAHLSPNNQNDTNSDTDDDDYEEFCENFTFSVCLLSYFSNDCVAYKSDFVERN